MSMKTDSKRVYLRSKTKVRVTLYNTYGVAVSVATLGEDEGKCPIFRLTLGNCRFLRAQKRPKGVFGTKWELIGTDYAEYFYFKMCDSGVNRRFASATDKCPLRPLTNVLYHP